MEEKLLEVRGLSVYYGEFPAVRNLSFSVRKGEILCIVGESGSGKSTVLKAICGLLPPHASVEGEILFAGRNLLRLSQKELNGLRGKLMGFIFQEPSVYLDPLYPVGKQIEETCEIHRGKDCFFKTLEALKNAGISEPEKVFGLYPHQLSGGLKQRVNIADATVNAPLLLLADEPTTALDVSTQKRILNLFRRLKEKGFSVVLVTHDLGVVWEVADRVVVLKEGLKVEEGTVFEIYSQPKSDYTKKLVDIFRDLWESTRNFSQGR